MPIDVIFYHIRRKILKEAQFISIVGFDDNVLHSRIIGKERFVEIHLKNKQPWCEVDRTYDCSHVGFALALPEVRNAINS